MADSSHCFYCREDLGGKRFVRSEGKPVCVRCHTKFCANSCAECHRPISVETKVCSPDGFNRPITSGGVNYQEQPWHSHCFVCSSCSKPLAGSSFTTHQDQVFCVDCYKSSVAKKCSGCQNPITGLIKLKLFLVVMTEQNTL
ncbi:hypothetical protein GOODEAATRI_023113 [Goodea atripinnis]|uniref:LIM zinc-binding domain-containing protein n=1 Tax=Goodea atripinnis TaxID=208336 RepID=A0ABV0NZP9_9TELE